MSLQRVKAALTAAVGSVAVTLGVVSFKPVLVVPVALLGVGGFAVLGVLAVIGLVAVFAKEDRRKSALDVIKAVFGRKES